jgi:RHS repeat-associated protein
VASPGFKIVGATNRLIAPTDVNGNENGSSPNDKLHYDQAGNLVKDSHTQNAPGARTYDAENRMLTADGPNGLSNTYTYDADGKRTRRSVNNGAEVWWQVFGLSGELVAEYQLVSGTPTLKKEFGYRNGELLIVAEATSSSCQWMVTDALGTPRILADQTGSLAGIKRRDYLPFGEEILAGVGHRATTNGYATTQATTPRQQFTGKERDSETGLDYFEARYYGAVYGRFTSPDEFTGGPDELYDFADVAADNPTFYAEFTQPQSLNKYQYAFNNPLKFVDPDGHQAGAIAEYLLQTGRQMEATPNPAVQKAGILVVAAGGALAAATRVDWNKVGNAIGNFLDKAPVNQPPGYYQAKYTTQSSQTTQTNSESAAAQSKKTDLSKQKKDRSIEGAQDQLEGIQKKADAKKKRGHKEPGQKKQHQVESDQKSQDNLDYEIEQFRRKHNKEQMTKPTPNPAPTPKPGGTEER